MPRGELLGGECVALGGGERRVNFLLARGEKLTHGRGVEGGVRAWARHGRRAYQTGGTTLVRVGLPKYGTCVHSLPCGVASVGGFLAFSGNSP